MSLLSRIFGSRSRELIDSKQVCIVDTTGFIEKRYREANGMPSPRDNFFVLKNIAYFAQREGIEMIAVFIGRPLREAGDGDSFKDVTVYYANDEKSLAQKISRLARSGPARKEIVVVTDDRQIERDAIKDGVQCMRLSTFKRGMEGGFDHDRDRDRGDRDRGDRDRGDRDRGARARDRQPRQSSQRRAPAPESETQPAPSEEKQPVSEEKAPKDVLDLIDPI